MKLVHFSSRATITQERFLEAYGKQHPGPKPIGMWLSDEHDYGWYQWCKSAQYSQSKNSFRYAHIVKLADDAKILYITTEQKLRWFGSHYAKKNDDLMGFKSLRSWEIDWGRVAEKYDGIVISPYRWECRLDPKCSWYYGWDCASGCIWNARAIKSIKRSRTWMPKIIGSESANDELLNKRIDAFLDRATARRGEGA